MNRVAPTSLVVPILVAVFTLLMPGARAMELGVARRDVTPTEPIRLTGFASRKTSHVGVEQKLWAKALAIGTDREGPAVLITLDNCGLSEGTWREVRSRLAKSAKLRADRIVIASSHTHSGPATKDWAPNIFIRDLTSEEQGAIDRYTTALIANLEQVALEALKNRRAGRLSWSSGTVQFAANRRTRGGPVDHALPLLKAEDANGRLLALVANYACHCTTIGGEFNNTCGDWAGYAQEAIEREVPGAMALITIGCGADSNPSPRGGADAGLALAKQHGAEIGAAVKRLLGMTFVPLNSRLTTRAKEIQLPFAPHFTRDQWRARSTNAAIVGYHAKKWLARLERGEKLPESLYYPITTWSFGNDLALVFLPGEVVVDYALRLKNELAGQKLWVTGYANYVPCYIPSRRILAEGGYEAEDSLWYYDRPARLSTNVEDLIVTTVRDLVPKSFRRDSKRAELPPPLSPQESLKAIRTKAELTVELVASEPLIESPVAIDWDAQGRLWVCEMYDYPAGLNPPANPDRKYGEPLKEPPGGFTPGGRIKILTDRNGDGRYDTATLFLDGIPFPTGVMPWRKGALVCAAPDLHYAEDTNGDGRADIVRTNVTGFAKHNYQARVNGFTWGLDGWLHASSGLFGGKVKSLQTGKEIDLSGRDFRYQPDTGEIEPVAGISQFGRVRDDFDNWFGNDNSTWLWHYPLPDHYLRRNPFVNFSEPRVFVARGAEANRVFPTSRTLTRFNDPQMANIVTSACGPGVYRDTLLGDDYYGNIFICEPVHNLVHRLVLDRAGGSYTGRRAAGEERAEFLSSSDSWFRPVQTRTGQDGALYIVDMYRFVIEHPRWIPPERLKELDPRAGADMGRIYRVYPRGKKPSRVPKLEKASVDTLVETMSGANGPARDLAHQKLIERAASDSVRQQIARTSVFNANALAALKPAARVQTLAALRDLNLLRDDHITRALADVDVEVRRFALNLADGRPGCVEALMAFPNHPENVDGRLMRQYWLSVSGFESNTVHHFLSQQLPLLELPEWLLATRKAPFAAVEAIFRAAAPGKLGSTSGVPKAMSTLFAVMLADQHTEDLGKVLLKLVPPDEPTRDLASAWAVNALHAELLDHPAVLNALGNSGTPEVRRSVERLRNDFAGGQQVHWLMTGELKSLSAESIPAVIRILGHYAQSSATNRAQLVDLFSADLDASARQELLKAVARLNGDSFAREAVERWNSFGPSVRGTLLELLLAKENWSAVVLGGIEGGVVQANELSLTQRQRLRSQSREDVRVRAEKLFAAAVTNRRDVLAKYEGVGTLTPVKDRGRELFTKNCAQCHAFRGQGHDVGPNLAEFAGKSAADFVLAILDPNAGVNPNYVAYNVETKDGRSLSGIVRNETSSGLTLVQGGGVREAIPRRDIVSLRASALSLMPEGLEQAMSPQDMADLIAWLKSGTPAAFGNAAVADTSKARVEFLKADANGCAEVVTAAEMLPYPSWLGRLPMPYCRQSAGQERLVWRSTVLPAKLEATHTFRMPVGMGFASQPKGKFSLKVNGAALLEFDVSLTDRTWQGADGRARMRYLVKEANSEDSNGILEIDVPSAFLKAGRRAEFEVTGSASGSQRWFGIYQLPASVAGGGR
jgi:putative membrane-bound dehydrogenase-like protein